jgi:hypothetical protein
MSYLRYLCLFVGGHMSYLRYCVCLRIVGFNIYCFVFLCLVYPVLPVSLNCSFFIAFSIFCNIYLT